MSEATNKRREGVQRTKEGKSTEAKLVVLLSKKAHYYIEKGTLTTPKQLVLLSVMPSDAFKESITIDKPLVYNALRRKVMLCVKTDKKNRRS